MCTGADEYSRNHRMFKVCRCQTHFGLFSNREVFQSRRIFRECRCQCLSWMFENGRESHEALVILRCIAIKLSPGHSDRRVYYESSHIPVHTFQFVSQCKSPDDNLAWLIIVSKFGRCIWESFKPQPVNVSFYATDCHVGTMVKSPWTIFLITNQLSWNCSFPRGFVVKKLGRPCRVIYIRSCDFFAKVL